MEEDGYVVLQTMASDGRELSRGRRKNGSPPVDLVGMSCGDVVFVRTVDRKVAAPERAKIVGLPRPPGTRMEIWLWPRHSREPEIEAVG